jgi:polyhydroxybutyrate depolymerase
MKANRRIGPSWWFSPAAIAFMAACGVSGAPSQATSVDGGSAYDGRIDSGLDDAADGALPVRDAGSGGDALPVDGGSCGTRAGQRGLTQRSLMVAGLNRTYSIYLPQNLDPRTPVPFVFVHHGYTMSGQEMVDITQYSSLADTEGFGLAFPDGQTGPDSLGAPWNVGTNVCPSVAGPPPDATGDDFAFIDAMEADVSSDQCLDAAHVFLTGFSMGGYFAHHVGCMRPDIRAVAAHSGGTHDLGACVGGHKPIMIFHGDADPVIPVGCDDPAALVVPPGVTPSAAAWAQRNGCSTSATTTAVENGTCSYYEGCPSDGQVALCVLHGMGHCWAGGAADAGIYSCPPYASATQLEWQFFKTYAW